MLKFREKGVPVGDQDVTLEQQKFSPQELKDMGLPELPVKIPNRYKRRGELAATVKSGKQEINFDLTSDPRMSGS